MDEFENLSKNIVQQTEVRSDEDICAQWELLEILLNTREQGQMMEQLIKNQIEVKDGMIDKLHKELDYYKKDADGRWVRKESMLMKVIQRFETDYMSFSV